MSLRSKLFGGDPKLEAAAVSDPAHITIGAKGEHVRKIQLALTLLDDANIDLDGAYGPETAAAVLDYKKKRNIINRSYQTQADDIVGKMTMASLDREMHQRERVPRPPIRIVPKSNWVMGSQRNPTLFTLARRSGSLALNASAIGTAPRLGQINLNIEPKELRLLPRTTGLITVEDGAPGTVQVIGDPFIKCSSYRPFE
jgi:peptidoglycan hydrolase-like protein with peptidoglycan-binding domain